MTSDYRLLLRQELSTNSCDRTSQGIISGMEKYGFYFDKIRVFFVSSLEHRIYSLLEEFVYNTNSRWVKQFPCLKKFIDRIITWRDSLDNIVERDINLTEKLMKSIMKFITRNNLITFLLDSITLYHRLNKVCRELDLLGIENNILRSSTPWNFLNEQDALLDCDCFTWDFNTTTNCDVNSNAVSCNARKSIKYKRTVRPLVKNTYDRRTKYSQPSTSEYRERRQILDLNKNFFQQNEETSIQYSTCVAIGSQNDDIRKRSFNERPCSSKLKKTRNSLKLKIIVYNMFLNDYKHSSFKTSRLSLPCKQSDLITRIFEVDPFLTESCLIVIKRKFENSMYNVTSCLNNVLDKLNTTLPKGLCLNCEIYPGYISFKLKAGNTKKCLFVARIPVCQIICKRAIQQVYSSLSANTNIKSVTKKKFSELKCREQCDDNGINFNALECTDEDTKNFGACCSQLDQSSVEKITTDMSQNVAENNNEKSVTCTMTENVSRYIQTPAISSCNNSREDIAKEIFNTTSCVDEINCDSVEKCSCSSRENCVGTDDEVKNIFRNENLDSTSQIADINERKWICSSNKKSSLKNEICNTNACNITSFAQNSDDDKQLVEVNYNHFLNDNINSIDERFATERNDNSTLNSTKVEIEYSSHCSCQRDDFIDTTFDGDTSKENNFCIFEMSCTNADATEGRKNYSKTVQISHKNNNLLTISVHVPRSTILQKEINVDAGYSRVIWLISNGDKNASNDTKASDKRGETASRSPHALIVSEKGSRSLSNINKEMFDVKDRAQDFIASRIRFSTLKGKSQFNKDLRTSGISTKQYLRAENHSSYATSNASLCYCSFATASEFTINSKQDKFSKLDRFKKLSKFRGRAFMRSRSSVSSGTSTTIKHKATPRRHPNDYPARIRPQTILAMTKFRNSVDKSVDRVKHLIRAKLRKILFNNKTSKTVSRNKESFRDTKKKQTSDKYIKQGYNVTSRSICECCRQDYVVSSCESSNVILSIRRTNKENTQFHDYKLINGSKDLLSFRSIKTSSRSCNRSNRHDKMNKITRVTSYNKNSHQCDFKCSRTSVMVSSESAKISLTRNNSKYLGHCTCKREERICDKKHIFGVLTDVCNDYIDDLDRDLKLRLLKYVKLCKSIKRSLTRTLRSDDIYGINTTSLSDNDL